MVCVEPGITGGCCTLTEGKTWELMQVLKHELDSA